MKYVPPGFNRPAVTAGLRRAMGFGEPNRVEDKATFHFPRRTPPADTPADAEGVPFDPDVQPDRTPLKPPQLVPCAIEFHAGTTTSETFGDSRASRIEITLLDPDYQKVKGFSYVVVGGEKYVYSYTPPPEALGSLDVWTVICISEDER